MTDSLDQLLRYIAARAQHTTELGVAVEHVVAWALTQSPQYGGQIATIDRWEDFAAANDLAIKTDVGIDLVITTHSGEHWALQVKGHDTDKNGLLDATKRVDLDAFAKLFAASKLHPFTELFIVTTGAGVTSTVTTMNTAIQAGVISLGRPWLRASGDFPDYTTVENWWEQRRRA